MVGFFSEFLKLWQSVMIHATKQWGQLPKIKPMIQHFELSLLRICWSGSVFFPCPFDILLFSCYLAPLRSNLLHVLLLLQLDMFTREALAATAKGVHDGSGTFSTDFQGPCGSHQDWMVLFYGWFVPQTNQFVFVWDFSGGCLISL